MSKKHSLKNDPEKKSRSLVSSFGDAFSGICFAVVSQRNMKIHLAAAICAIGVGIGVELDTIRWAILCLTIALVLALEVLNTAMEQFVDLVSPDYCLSAKRMKDLAAGAVFIAAVCSVIVGCILFLPAIVEKISAG